MVQDLLDDRIGSSTQPRIFLYPDNFSHLASSPLLARTYALRLRIPGRELIHSMRPSRWRPSLPHIAFLDLSSTRLSDSDVSKLLRSLPRLRHLVLDHCGLLDGACARDWAAFAHHCMLPRKDITLEQRVNRHFVALGSAGESRPREVRILPRVSALRRQRGRIAPTRGAHPPARVGAAHAVAVCAHARGGRRAARAPCCVPARMGGGRSDIQRDRICRSAVPRGGTRADVPVPMAWRGGQCAAGVRLPWDGGCRRRRRVCAAERGQGRRGLSRGVPRRTDGEGRGH